MLIQAWRFITILLTALLMGTTFCHVLELPAKMQYDPSLYLTLHRSLYVAFGWPNVGAFIELGAILAAIVLAFLVYQRRPAFWLTVFGAICLLTGLAVYFSFIEPANIAMKSMAILAPPADWAVWRNQWEYGHAAHFGLHLLAFSALAFSLILEPATVSATVKRQESTRSLLHEQWQPER